MSETKQAAEKSSTFTLVFEGDLRKYPGNFFKVDTPFGKPLAAGLGNAFDEIERLHEAAFLPQSEVAESQAAMVNSIYEAITKDMHVNDYGEWVLPKDKEIADIAETIAALIAKGSDHE
jgi:hypothetical protein